MPGWEKAAARRERSAELHRAGLRVEEIAVEVGVSLSTCRKYLRDSGIRLDKGRAAHRRHAEELERAAQRDDRAEALWRDGLGVDEIADLLGVTRSTVAVPLRERGIRLDRSRGRQSGRLDARRREIFDLHHRGMGTLEIADRIGVSLSTVRSDLRRMGVKFSKGRPTIASDPDQIERMRILYQDYGWTCGEIGWMVGRTAQAIQRRLRGHTEIGRRRAEVREMLRRRAERVRYFYEKGETLGFIAYNLDIGIETVRMDLHRSGAKLRGRDEHPWVKQSRREIDEFFHRRYQKWRACNPDPDPLYLAGNAEGETQ